MEQNIRKGETTGSWRNRIAWIKCVHSWPCAPKKNKGTENANEIMTQSFEWTKKWKTNLMWCLSLNAISGQHLL